MIYRLVLSFIVGDTLLGSFVVILLEWSRARGKLKLKANLRFFSLPYKRQFYLRWEPEQAAQQEKRGSGSGWGDRS